MLIQSTIRSNAQNPQSLFTLNKREIKTKLTELYDMRFLGHDVSNGVPYDSYHQNNGGGMISCFFNRQGQCFQITSLYSNSQYSSVVSNLNQKLVKIKINKWRTQSESMVINLIFLKNVNMFSVAYRSMLVEEPK